MTLLSSGAGLRRGHGQLKRSAGQRSAHLTSEQSSVSRDRASGSLTFCLLCFRTLQTRRSGANISEFISEVV